MEDILHSGLTFRGHPLAFKDPSQCRLVTLLDLPYGIPPASISSSLIKYGKIKEIKSETHLGVYTGVRLLLMEVTVAIPSRVRIAGHECTIFYRGQVRTCFKCKAIGHEAKKCPRSTATATTDKTTTTVTGQSGKTDTQKTVRKEKRKRSNKRDTGGGDEPNTSAHPPTGLNSTAGEMDLDAPTTHDPIPPLLLSDDEFDMTLSDPEETDNIKSEDTPPVNPQSLIPKPPHPPPSDDRRPIATRMRELASDPESGLRKADAEAQIVKLKDWAEILKDPACETDRLKAVKEIDRLHLNLDIHFAKQAIRKYEAVHLAAREAWTGVDLFDEEPFFGEFHRLEQALLKAQQAVDAVPKKLGGVGIFPPTHPA